MFLGTKLQTVEVTGRHSSPDEKWNNARVTYWAISDLVEGNGSQRGYYVTEHPVAVVITGPSKARLVLSKVGRGLKAHCARRTEREYTRV